MADSTLIVIAGTGVTLSDLADGSGGDPTGMSLQFATLNALAHVQVVIRKPDLATWHLSRAMLTNFALNGQNVVLESFQIDGKGLAGQQSLSAQANNFVLFGDPSAGATQTVTVQGVDWSHLSPVQSNILFQFANLAGPNSASFQIEIGIWERFDPRNFQFPFRR